MKGKKLGVTGLPRQCPSKLSRESPVELTISEKKPLKQQHKIPAINIRNSRDDTLTEEGDAEMQLFNAITIRSEDTDSLTDQILGHEVVVEDDHNKSIFLMKIHDQENLRASHSTLKQYDFQPTMGPQPTQPRHPSPNPKIKKSQHERKSSTISMSSTGSIIDLNNELQLQQTAKVFSKFDNKFQLTSQYHNFHHPTKTTELPNLSTMPDCPLIIAQTVLCHKPTKLQPSLSPLKQRNQKSQHPPSPTKKQFQTVPTAKDRRPIAISLLKQNQDLIEQKVIFKSPLKDSSKDVNKTKPRILEIYSKINNPAQPSTTPLTPTKSTALQQRVQPNRTDASEQKTEVSVLQTILENIKSNHKLSYSPCASKVDYTKYQFSKSSFNEPPSSQFNIGAQNDSYVQYVKSKLKLASGTKLSPSEQRYFNYLSPTYQFTQQQQIRAGLSITDSFNKFISHNESQDIPRMESPLGQYDPSIVQDRIKQFGKTGLQNFKMPQIIKMYDKLQRAPSLERQQTMQKAIYNRDELVIQIKRKHEAIQKQQQDYYKTCNSLHMTSSKLPFKQWIDVEVMRPLKHTGDLMSVSFKDHLAANAKLHNSIDLAQLMRDEIRRPSKPQAMRIRKVAQSIEFDRTIQVERKSSMEALVEEVSLRL